MSAELLFAVLGVLVAAGGIIAATAAVHARGREAKRKAEQECEDRVRRMEERRRRELESEWDR
jgi:hypothetical protein